MPFTIRIRTKAFSRLIYKGANPDDKLSSVLEQFEKIYAINIKAAYMKQNYTEEINVSKTLKQLKLKNGVMIYATLGAGTAVIDGHGIELDEDGRVVTSKTGKGLLPGTRPLGAEKRNWTLAEMVEREKKFTFELLGAKADIVEKATLDISSCQDFVNFLSKTRYKNCRCGLLLGKFVDSDAHAAKKKEEKMLKEYHKVHKHAYGSTAENMKLSDLEKKIQDENKAKHAVIVDCIYEPPQKNIPERFEVYENKFQEECTQRVANALGLEVVGFIVSHPHTEEYVFNASEIIHAAQYSIESSASKKDEPDRDSPFILVKVMNDGNNNVSFEPYTLTSSLIDMVVEDAVIPAPDNPSHVATVSPFKAIVEKKEVHVVDNDFFIKSVPVLNFDSELSKAAKQGNFYPRLNRSTSSASGQFPKFYRSVVGSKNMDAVDRVDILKLFNNFHVLMDLSVGGKLSVEGLHTVEQYLNNPEADISAVKKLLKSLV